MSLVLVVVSAAVAAAGVSWKWLRVSQREHYGPGRCTRMAWIWCMSKPVNLAALCGLLLLALVSLALGGIIGSIVAVAVALGSLLWPYRLATFPKSRPFAWTPRSRRLAAVLTVLAVVIGSGIAAIEPLALCLWVLAIPLMVDLAAAVLAPLEVRLGAGYVESAREGLAAVAPQVIAITGSYGKTSTKVALATILEGSRRTLVSPASFNNLQGLSKTVNDRLVPGVEVFVAEMGTYGPGEIKALCDVFRPEIVAITTIGEAHLERMRDRATIVKAKSEIVEGARIVVLNVEVPELASLAESLADGQRVIGVSTSEVPGADVIVDMEAHRLLVKSIGYNGPLTIPDGSHPANIAVAVGLALAADVSIEDIVSRIPAVTVPEHRAEVNTTPQGLLVIDDTYNSNPSGAATALGLAVSRNRPGGTIFVVTPGMVELGHQQSLRNRDFAASIPVESGHLIIVGWTNRRALSDGASKTGVRVSVARSRDIAASMVGKLASPGDVVLFENDLPDHYP